MSAEPGVGALRGSAFTAGTLDADQAATVGIAGSAPPLGEPKGRSAGRSESMRRDSIFRRALLVADALAIVGAFLLTIQLASKSLQLTWASIAALPILLLGAKILGLYDRDEVVLRKTTLDEAPKLFQVATICA